MDDGDERARSDVGDDGHIDDSSREDGDMDKGGRGGLWMCSSLSTV